MKIIKLNYRYNAYKKFGHKVAIELDYIHEMDTIHNIYDYFKTISGMDYCSRFSSTNKTDFRCMISFKDESMLSALTIMGII